MHLGPINSGSGRYERKKFANNRLTQDFERYQRIINTPYPVPGATFAWIDATFKAIKLAFSDKTLKAIPEETHILGPSHDQVVDPRAWQDWIKKARAMGHQTTSYELFHGARHELLAEIRSIYSRTLRKIEKILKS
jgi:alpha-beta hydrolase superfamily lysophospholipase